MKIIQKLEDFLEDIFYGIEPIIEGAVNLYDAADAYTGESVMIRVHEVLDPAIISAGKQRFAVELKRPTGKWYHIGYFEIEEEEK